MTFDPWFYAKLTALGFVVIVVQIAAVSQLTFFGQPADLAPLLVASIGLLCGSLVGAGFGFAVGLMVDTFLVQTLGVTSLVLVAIGYAAGRLAELRDPSHGLAPMVVGMMATAAAAVGFSVLQFLLGVEAPVSWVLLRSILVVVAVNGLLCLPVHWLCRRVLRAHLPEEPRRRRRRAYTTGGLSPLSRA